MEAVGERREKGNDEDEASNLEMAIYDMLYHDEK